MEQPERILAALNEFEKKTAKEIPPLLDDYLRYVAKTGEPLFPWVKVKPLFTHKLDVVMKEFYATAPTETIAPNPNLDVVPFDIMRARLLDTVSKFQGIPFTIQRLCELLVDPKKHYKRTDKFLRGIEKNVLVVSTVDPFAGRTPPEGYSFVNGMMGNGDTDELADSTAVAQEEFIVPAAPPGAGDVNYPTPNITHDLAVNITTLPVYTDEPHSDIHANAPVPMETEPSWAAEISDDRMDKPLEFATTTVWPLRTSSQAHEGENTTADSAHLLPSNVTQESTVRTQIASTHAQHDGIINGHLDPTESTNPISTQHLLLPLEKLVNTTGTDVGTQKKRPLSQPSVQTPEVSSGTPLARQMPEQPDDAGSVKLKSVSSTEAGVSKVSSEVVSKEVTVTTEDRDVIKSTVSDQPADLDIQNIQKNVAELISSSQVVQFSAENVPKDANITTEDDNAHAAEGSPKKPFDSSPLISSSDSVPSEENVFSSCERVTATTDSSREQNSSLEKLAAGDSAQQNLIADTSIKNEDKESVEVPISASNKDSSSIVIESTAADSSRTLDAAAEMSAVQESIRVSESLISDSSSKSEKDNAGVAAASSLTELKPRRLEDDDSEPPKKQMKTGHNSENGKLDQVAESRASPVKMMPDVIPQVSNKLGVPPGEAALSESDSREQVTKTVDDSSDPVTSTNEAEASGLETRERDPQDDSSSGEHFQVADKVDTEEAQPCDSKSCEAAEDSSTDSDVAMEVDVAVETKSAEEDKMDEN